MSKSRNLEPIISHVVLQLSDLGIQSTSASFQISKLQSSHFLCAHEKEAETNNVTMMDLANSNKVVRYTIIADSAIIHPYSYVIAMRAGRQLKIFNVEKQTDVGPYIFPEDIHFAKWISDTTIGVITEKVIFHWDTRDTTPRRICDRHSWFSGAQIIDYQTTLGEKWMALVGIVKDAESGESQIRGLAQLCNTKSGESRLIGAHAGTFAEAMLDENSQPSRLWIYVDTQSGCAKLVIEEIEYMAPNTPFVRREIDLQSHKEVPSDFPNSVHVSKKYRVIYILTKCGFIHLHDLETGVPIYTHRISPEIIFSTALDESKDVIIAISREGAVFEVNFNGQAVIPYILSTTGDSSIAMKMARGANLSVSGDSLRPSSFTNSECLASETTECNKPDDDNSHASQRGIVICSQATDIKTLDDSSLPWEGDLKGFRFLDIKTVCSISAFEYWILTVSAGALVITLPSKVVIFNPARRSAREIEYGFEVKSWPSISHSLSPDGNTLVRWMQPEGPRSTTITSIDTSSKKQIGKLWVQRGFGKSDISNAKWMDNATVFIPVSSEGIIVRWTARDSGRQSQFLVRSRIQHDDYAVIRPLTKVSRFGLLKFDLTKDRKWWTITGVTYDKKPSGLIEVHDVEKKSSREVEGIASCIAEVDVYDKERALLVIVNTLPQTKLQLSVQQLNPHDSGQSFIPVDVEIDLIDKEDVPRGVYVLHPLPIVAITTARSYIYFFELHTGAYLYAQNLKPYKFWISQCDSQSLLMWAYETSAVQLVTINERDLIGYCRQVLCNDLLASTIAVHSGLRGAEDVIFHDMHGDYTQISS